MLLKIKTQVDLILCGLSKALHCVALICSSKSWSSNVSSRVTARTVMARTGGTGCKQFR